LIACAPHRHIRRSCAGNCIEVQFISKAGKYQAVQA
jgi:hypothetical protein